MRPIQIIERAIFDPGVILGIRGPTVPLSTWQAQAVIAFLEHSGYVIIPARGIAATRQIRAMPPGTIFEVSSLEGKDRKAVYNAATYAVRCGEVEHISYGKYRRAASQPNEGGEK